MRSAIKERRSTRSLILVRRLSREDEQLLRDFEERIRGEGWWGSRSQALLTTLRRRWGPTLRRYVRSAVAEDEVTLEYLIGQLQMMMEFCTCN